LLLSAIRRCLILSRDAAVILMLDTPLAASLIIAAFVRY
jgi:hypothetical protein